MPADPRTAKGSCRKFANNNNPWNGQFKPWQTGGAGAGQIPAAISEQYTWPPATLNAVPEESISLLPQYTSTAAPITLAWPDPTTPPAVTTTTQGKGKEATPTLTAKTQHGDGWANKQDNAPAVGPIPGCAYPYAYGAEDAQVPATGCLPAA